MQISFDPQNCGAMTLRAVVDILRLFHPGEIEKMVVTPAVPATPETLTAAGLGIDADRPDNRDAAAVFGAASGAGALPLPLAPSTAVAGPSTTAPVVPPASFQTALPVVSLPAATAPLPGVPSAPAATTNPVGAVELDTTGLPWDVRIHAGTKRRNADGTWTAKKGINDPALVARVQAELRAVQALPSAGPLAPASSPAAAPPASPSAVTTPVAGLPLPLPVVAGPPANFDELMPRITAAVNAGTLQQDTLLQAVQAHQLPSLVALTARPDYVVHIWNYLKQQFPALA